MSDIEEMDSEQLNELESILYASIHYNDATREQEQQALDMELDAQSMPPPQQQHPEQKQQQKQLRFVSDKRIINNATSKPRYWAEAKSDVASDNGALKAKTSTSAESSNTEQPKEAPPATNVDVVATPKNKRPDANSPKKPTSQQKPPKANPNPVKQLLQKQQQMRQALKMQQVQKRQQPQIQQKPPKPAPQQQNIKANAYDEPERFDQRLLVAIPSNCGPVSKRERKDGPFAKSNRKLEQFQKFATKKQKSMRAQTNKKLKQIKGQPIEMISLVDSSDHSDTDDVIIVPLPPVPIIDVDASDDEEEAPAAYIEENAMDAADVSLSGGDCATTQMTVVRSVMHSPCSSVLSSDDFIVQKDTSRLIADRARATDEDLLVLTENAIRNAADPECEDTTAEPDKAADTSSEYEFVPPSRLEEIKQNYRVDEQQFRALDVYESESDLTEGGIYCKAKQKFAPTIIRNVDSESESSDVEQVIEVNVNKTKRLRKRRASSTNQSQSDPNNEADKDNEDDDTDSDVDGVHATGVPGISRGMALERCKRKIRRISQRRSSESALQAVPRKMEDTNDASSDSATEESLPTARQIAERLLMQKQANEKEQKQEKEQEEEREEEEEDEAMDSVGSDANTEDEAEMHNVSEQMSKVFERIDQNTKLSQTKQIEPEKKPQIESITADQDLDQISDDELELSSETDAEADVVQVEHNMSELKEQLSGGDLVGWNEEMCRFYNDSWGGENFNLHRIQRAMSSLRSDWRVINADRFPTARKRSNLKCNNCFEMGHMRAKCPRPRKPVVCYTCGMTGHAEPRCPNAICLGCGAKQPLYVQKCNKCSIQSRMICQLCKMRGHSIDMCPDKWRRYHSTTRSNVELESRVQYRQKNCSYCAARGHLFEDCRQRIGEYRHTNYTQRIISHQKVYKDRPEPISYSSDLDNFFALDIPFHFNWSSEFSKNSIYARFLKAVGLPRPVDKRKVSAPPMQMKLYTHDYVPNPAATAALGKAPTTTASVIIEELPAETQATSETVTEVEEVQAEVQPEAETDNNINQLSSDVIATTVVKPTVPPHDLDSDSNYSFSEHFEVPAEQVSTPKPTKTGPMENLPDVIPLNSIADDNSDNNNDNDEQMSISGNNQGISMCVNSKATEDQPQSLPDLPSEAKIIMARDQTEYLFSPEGREFLATAAKQCNVNVRMDFKEYGYVLVIYGLKKDQEDLQIRLLRRNQEVMRKSSDFQSQKPPKRVDVLIRFMRDGINSLSSDLGNAKNHYHRIKQLEEMNTKNGFKQAERKRRLLNMILIGQAGLSNGSMHLDQLLSILKRLLDEHSGDENATPALRSEIEEHWRFIFSPNPHPNYDLLLENYSRLDTKNRMTVLNIEPAVLGLPNSCKRNRVASPPPPPPAWQQQQQQDVNKMRSPKQRIISNEQQSPIPQAMPIMQQQQQQQQNRTPKQRTQQKRQTRPMPPVWQHDEQQQQQPQQKQQQQKQLQPQQKQLQQKQLQPNQKQNQQQQLQQRQQQQLHQKQQQQHLQQRQLQLHQRQQQQQQQLQLRQQQHLKQQTHNSNMNKNRIQKQQRQQPYVKLAHGQQYSMPFNNPLQRVPNGLLLQRNPLQSQCVKLLDGMERGNRITSDATAPSVYWSRETMQHLDDLFKIPVNPETVERLHRVLERSRRGQLSHNDYRAVIKLKSLMVPH